MFNKGFKKKVLRVIGNLLVAKISNVLCKSLRIEEINKPSFDFENKTNGAIYTFWHGKMLVPWYILRKNKPVALVSQSKDGDLLIKVLEHWNYKVKRGSSSTDGKKVLDELISDAQNGNTIAITPDGPKGPIEVMKAGAVIISKKGQIPLILVAVNYNKSIKLNSWDRFEVPYFFSKVKIIYSDPIVIDEKLTYEETDEMIKDVQNKFNKLKLVLESN